MATRCCRFEGEGSQHFRILRAMRPFGPTDEIGVFEMTGLGLREVSNPSELFLSERDLGSRARRYLPGSRATRPVLWNCRPWWRRPRSARHGGPWWAGIRAGCRWSGGAGGPLRGQTVRL